MINEILPPLIVIKFAAKSGVLLSLNKLMQTPFTLSYF